MKKFVLMMACGVAAWTAVAQNQPAPAPAAPAAAPKIVCEQPAFDFGQAEQGSVVNHDYIVKNGGDLTLELRNVRASCGCTVAKTSTNIVKPGETAIITASLNLANRNGHQEKHIIVESNDPQTPTLVLNLRGDVKKIFDLSPERISAGQIRNDQVSEMSAEFINNSPGLVHVRDVKTTVPNLKTELVTVEDGRKYKINVKTVPPLQAGQLEGVIQLITDYPAQPVFELPYNAAVLGLIAVVPPKIMLDGGVTTPVNRPIILQPGTVSSFKVLSVESPDPSITVEQAPFGPVRVRIQLNNIVAKPELDGKAVKITTDVEGMKEIFVPFQVLNIQQAPAPVSGTVAAPPHS